MCFYFSYENYRKTGITGLKWNPSGNQVILVTDSQGNLGLFDDVLEGEVEKPAQEVNMVNSLIV